MTISVKGYSRHINGKLVTVHGYDANRDQVLPTGNVVVQRMHVNRGELAGMAPAGQYITPNFKNPLTQGLGGLTAYLYQPGSKERDLPVYRFRRTHLPKHGAYRIPKRESGNPDEYISD